MKHSRRGLFRLAGGMALGASLPLNKLVALLPAPRVASTATLTSLIPTMYAAFDELSRELVGFIPAVAAASFAELGVSDEDA